MCWKLSSLIQYVNCLFLWFPTYNLLVLHFVGPNIVHLHMIVQHWVFWTAVLILRVDVTWFADDTKQKIASYWSANPYTESGKPNCPIYKFPDGSVQCSENM